MLCGHRELAAGEIAEAILSDVSRFQDGRDRFDDETIIVLKVR
jgi:sigma-B regulation protein RsbU (phosphoserine phosphatase)